MPDSAGPITESLLRRVLEDTSGAFLIGLVTIIAMRLHGNIDSNTFGSCFSVLMPSYMAALAWGK